MSAVGILFKRELTAYFATPLAYVYTTIFLMLAGVFTFYMGNFYERQQADLAAFFNFHPWLYLFLVPAVSMRLWAEDRRNGVIELLMTLPVHTYELVLGKFLAAWCFTGIALALTFPVWLTVSYLGDPDHGVIIASYLGSWLMSGSFLAVGSCMSAATRNQVIAFIFSLVICFLFIVSGFSIVLDAFSGWAPTVLLDAIASLSFLTHFDAISKGVISFRDLFYFIGMIVVWLIATTIVIDLKKAE